MKSLGPHLQETRLFDCYLAVKDGENLDPPVAEHLTDCDACGERYAELARFMDALHSQGTAEADEIFTAERLGTQRMQISRRIAHLGQPARVISFPDRTSGHRLGAVARPSSRRWIGAAAAAGLFIGVATGLFLDWEAGRGDGRRAGAAGARQTVQTVLTSPADQARRGEATRTEGDQVELVRSEPSESDEAFLSELERAGDRPRIRELIAVDALTPHVREINLR